MRGGCNGYIYVLRNVHTVWLYYRLWVFGHNGGGWDNAVCRVLPRLVRRYTNHYLYHNTTPATLPLLLSPAVATIVSHHHLRAQCFYAILLVLFVCFASDCESSAPKTMSTLIYFTHFSHCVTRLDFCSVHLFTDGFDVLRCDMSLYNFRWGWNSILDVSVAFMTLEKGDLCVTSLHSQWKTELKHICWFSASRLGLLT